MQKRLWLMLALVTAGTGLSGCVPVIAAGGVVVADSIAEDRRGGDGLF